MIQWIKNQNKRNLILAREFTHYQTSQSLWSKLRRLSLSQRGPSIYSSPTWRWKDMNELRNLQNLKIFPTRKLFVFKEIFFWNFLKTRNKNIKLLGKKTWFDIKMKWNKSILLDFLSIRTVFVALLKSSNWLKRRQKKSSLLRMTNQQMESSLRKQVLHICTLWKLIQRKFGRIMAAKS